MFETKHKGVLFLLLLLLFQLTVRGQAIFDTLNLREFEIIGQIDNYKDSYKATTFDTLVKRNFEHFDLGQLLSAFSPVFVKSYGRGSISSASFRGTSASHTQVLWNDFAINSPMLGQVDFSYIPESFFDEVGLLYGGGSLYCSGGALGGSVLLTNKIENSHKPLFRLSQSVGSFGSFNTNAAVNIEKGGIKAETRAMLQTSRNNFSYYNNGVLPSEWMKQNDASFINSGFLQKFSWQINGSNHLSLMSWNQWNNRNIPPIMTNVYKGGDPEEYQKTFFTRNVLAWLYHKKMTRVEIKSASFYEKQHYYLKTTTSNDSAQPVTLINSQNNTFGFYTKGKWRQQFNNGLVLKAGCDVAYNRVQSTNYNSQITRLSTSFYASVYKRFFERLSFDLLVREELVDGLFLPVMPYAGINYKLLKKERLFIRVSVSRNYHLPTLNDLYWYPAGNPDLKPEDGVEAEAGVNYRKMLTKNISFFMDVTTFYNKTSNWILWKPTDYRYWSPENIADVLARGVEMSLGIKAKVGDWFYSLSTNYAYTRTTDESALAVREGYNGRQLIYIPVHHGNAFFFVKYKHWNMGWNTFFTDLRNTTMNPADSYSNSLRGYCLNDIFFGKKWKLKKMDFALQLKLNNLFNVQYQAVIWRAMPGRNGEVVVKVGIR